MYSPRQTPGLGGPSLVVEASNRPTPAGHPVRLVCFKKMHEHGVQHRCSWFLQSQPQELPPEAGPASPPSSSRTVIAVPRPRHTTRRSGVCSRHPSQTTPTLLIYTVVTHPLNTNGSSWVSEPLSFASGIEGLLPSQRGVSLDVAWLMMMLSLNLIHEAPST